MRLELRALAEVAPQNGGCMGGGVRIKYCDGICQKPIIILVLEKSTISEG